MAIASSSSGRSVAERLLISRLGRLGEGIAETPAGPLHVPYTLPGDSVTVDEWTGHPDRRRLLTVDVASNQRIAPICPHFGVCGGCALQHWSTDRYREWKRALVVEALAQVGLGAMVDPLIDAHGEGRRRAVFHARRGTRDVLAVGFAALRAHHVVPIDRCPVLAPALDGALAAAWSIAEALKGWHKPLDIHVTASDAGLDVDVRGSGPLPATQAAALARVAEQHRLARLTRHGEIVVMRAIPTVSIGRARLVLPPGAFLQATAAGEEALGQLVIENCDRAQKIVDLFAGVGPFALRLAERARVTAVDNDKPAIEAMQRAVASTQGLKPVETLVRDLFRSPFTAPELQRSDAVVFDPPRQGAQAQARALAVSKIATIVAVSCNPTTFARDARILVDGGYRLTRVTPVDQFLYSPHVELVAKFQR
jgi:23S rRNA (uracil1939-C5)-methyltransferase